MARRGVLVFFLLLMPLLADARGGGGGGGGHGGGGGGHGGFGGGGFHGGGYYGGGSYYRRSYYDNGICYDSLNNRVPCPRNFGDPVLYTVLALMIGAGIYSFATSKSAYRSPYDMAGFNLILPSARYQAKAQETKNALSRIAPSDPRYRWEEMALVARKAFTTLQEAWTQRSYAQMEALVVHPLAHVHRAKLDNMIQNHEINRIDQLDIHFVEPVHVVQSADPRDCLFTVLIEASAIDYYIDDRNNARLRGQTRPETFQEFWTFQWERGGWRLREIEQTTDSDALSRMNLMRNAGVAHGTAQGPAQGAFQKATAHPSTASKLELLVGQWAKLDPEWRLENLYATARNLGLTWLLVWEKGSIEPLQGRITHHLQRKLEQELAQARAQNRRVEFRGMCVRGVDLVFARRSIQRGEECAVRIVFNAQRIEYVNDQVVRADPGLSAFAVTMELKRESAEFLLNEVTPS